MKRVTVTIEQASDGYFWCRTEEEVYGAGLNAVGKTIEKAKEDLAECMEEARKDYEERGEKVLPRRIEEGAHLAFRRHAARIEKARRRLGDPERTGVPPDRGELLCGKIKFTHDLLHDVSLPLNIPASEYTLFSEK